MPIARAGQLALERDFSPQFRIDDTVSPAYRITVKRVATFEAVVGLIARSPG